MPHAQIERMSLRFKMGYVEFSVCKTQRFSSTRKPRLGRDCAWQLCLRLSTPRTDTSLVSCANAPDWMPHSQTQRASLRLKLDGFPYRDVNVSTTQTFSAPVKPRLGRGCAWQLRRPSACEAMRVACTELTSCDNLPLPGITQSESSPPMTSVALVSAAAFSAATRRASVAATVHGLWQHSRSGGCDAGHTRGSMSNDANGFLGDGTTT